MNVFSHHCCSCTGCASQGNQTGKRKKKQLVGKKEVKLTLFTNDVIVYIKNPMESTKKLLELVS